MIGRKAEQELLVGLLDSNKAEFLAVYGRRRVGKTFLIKEFFHGHFAFYTTGVPHDEGIGIADQLGNFALSLKEYGADIKAVPRTWAEAFVLLKELIEQNRSPGKKVIFIDEMPWLDTPRSKFLPALDFFWNSWASSRPDILLVACGSAAAWMDKKILKGRGGLHNRVTMRMQLKPFTLGECEEYYRHQDIVVSRRQAVENYMVFGGIPYYLSLLNPRLSPAENIDRLFFGEDALLKGEYYILLRSLFRHSENHERIIRTLSTVRKGLTRSEIVKRAKIADGGTLTDALSDLQLSGFIRKYTAFKKRERDTVFQLVDPYCLFYHTFIVRNDDSHFWQKYLISPSHNSWSGYAFELVCLLHSERIKNKTGAAFAIANIRSWRSEKSQPAAQIDMLIERSDGIIDICEMKYTTDDFSMSKADYDNLRNKCRAFAGETKTKKTLRLVLVTTYGLAPNECSEDIQIVVTMDDLFSA